MVVVEGNVAGWCLSHAEVLLPQSLLTNYLAENAVSLLIAKPEPKPLSPRHWLKNDTQGYLIWKQWKAY